MKGISPLIATVILIAITVAVGGIVSTWMFGFTRSSTAAIGEKANIEIICGSGGISLSDLCYSNGYLLGYIKNTGTIPLGNITITIIYTNASIQRYYLSFAGGAVVANAPCCGNLSVSVNEKYKFNISASGNYDRIYVYTNCTAKVTYEAKAYDVLIC